MKITKKQIFSFLFLSTFLFIAFVGILNAPAVNAGDSLWNNQTGMKDVGKAFGESGEPNDIKIIVVRIINIFLGFLGIIMVVLLVWAGYKWMTSQGNEETIKQAKSQIQTAIIGLAIILMAYSIAAYVTQCMYDIVDGGMASFLCN